MEEPTGCVERSITRTDRPFSWAKNAVARPTTPPPTTMTSVFMRFILPPGYHKEILDQASYTSVNLDVHIPPPERGKVAAKLVMNGESLIQSKYITTGFGQSTCTSYQPGHSTKELVQ